MAALPSSNPIRPFVATTTLLLIIAALYLARVVVVPVVLAALLAFLLTPLVSWLQRYRIPRVAAALLTSLLAFAFFSALLVTVFIQFRTLASDLPNHQPQIHQKAESIHEMLSGDWLKEMSNLFDDTVRTISPPATPDPDAAVGPAAAPAPARTSNFWGPIMEWAFAPAIEIFVDGGVIMVLVVFMLAQHEDLRDRVIRLSGTRNVTSTTKALGDATRRVRRYLLHQFFINCAFGLVVAGGLAVIGVPYPLLWGVLGAALRYVPYIGTWLAAVCPVLLSVVLMKGWWPPLLAFGLFVLLDIVITNALEPIVYGRSVGVSGTALLVAAVFWTWMWGPIGLILSTPLTACVVVLGRHVAALEFFGVLLGDQPPLSAALGFYQRLLARDEDEASTLVEKYAQDHGVENVYDHVITPALVHVKEGVLHDKLTPEDEEFILGATWRMLEDVVFPDQEKADAAEVAADGATVKRRLSVLGCPARDEVDEIGLRMLQRLLPKDKYPMEVLPKGALAGEVLTRVAEAKPAVVVIGAAPPYSFSAIRYLCKRLRVQSPTLKIVVGCWGLREDVKESLERLKAAGADMASAELLETRAMLLPLIQDASVTRAAASEAVKSAEKVHA